MKQSNDENTLNLGSSVNKVGKTVTQIIHFKGGYRKTIHGIKTETVEQVQFTKFKFKSLLWI